MFFKTLAAKSGYTINMCQTVTNSAVHWWTKERYQQRINCNQAVFRKQTLKPKKTQLPSNCMLLVIVFCGFLYDNDSSCYLYSVSQKFPPPCGFLTIFPKRLGIFNQFFTHLLYVPFYTRVQIFIQLSPTMTKLCHTKRDHPANFYILLELLSLLTEQMTSLLTSCHIQHVC